MVEPYEQAGYYRIRHFISEFRKDHVAAFDNAAKDASRFLFCFGKVGLLIDESEIGEKANLLWV